MRITAVWFSCARDVAPLAESMASLEGKVDHMRVVIDEADAGVMEGVDFVSNFPRGGNLNGRECVIGMLVTMRSIAAETAADEILKIDSDVISTRGVGVVDDPSAALTGGWREIAGRGGHAWGGAYMLSRDALEALPWDDIDGALDEANKSVGGRLSPRWPEDETVTALFRLLFPGRVSLRSQWLARMNYANPSPNDQWYAFREFGGYRWQLGGGSRWHESAENVRAMAEQMHNARTTIERMVTRPSPGRRRRAVALSFGDWACFSPLIHQLRHMGYGTECVRPGPGDDPERLLAGVDVLAVWNGGTPRHVPIIEAAAAMGVRVVYCELGFFPQSRHVFFDPEGVGARSSVMADPLDWLTQEMRGRLEAFRSMYCPRHLSADYVLVPLQLEMDLNIREHSPFPTMQGFIEHCVVRFAGDHKVVFKRHPRDRSHYETLGCQMVTDGDIRAFARHASLVYGINSTALLECALMEGLPVEAIGDGYLRKPEPRDDVLAALLALQVGQTADCLPEFLVDRLGLG